MKTTKTQHWWVSESVSSLSTALKAQSTVKKLNAYTSCPLTLLLYKKKHIMQPKKCSIIETRSYHISRALLLNHVHPCTAQETSEPFKKTRGLYVAVEGWALIPWGKDKLLTHCMWREEMLESRHHTDQRLPAHQRWQVKGELSFLTSLSPPVWNFIQVHTKLQIFF